MNEAHRIRTALLASLSFDEASPEERKRLLELALTDLDRGRREQLAYEVTERLVVLGQVAVVDRFDRDGRRYVRYRVAATGDSFLLPAAEAPPAERLVRAQRPHWHARSRLLYRGLSHLIAIERKLFARDERNEEVLQTEAGDILRMILASTREILECDETRLYSLARGVEDIRYHHPVSEGEPWNRALADTWVAKRGLPVYVSDLTEEGFVEVMVDAEAMDATMHLAVAPYTPRPAPGGYRSLAMARVGEPGSPFLFALEAWSRTPRFFDPERLGILNVVAEHATDLLITLRKLGMLVMVDELTGIYNRPYFGRQLSQEIARAYREGRPMALVIADIDNFKKLNDLYGYEAGNVVLRELSQTLASSLRPFDTVARWGGEEFGIILSPETTREEGREICERLRLKVQNLAFLVPSLDGRENAVRVTMSMGGAVFPQDVTLPVEASRGLDAQSREKLAHELWTRANMNLKLAKESGRNQVRIGGD
jgi:diguanylate cyclase (GGDEF)-like protein